jgi:anti-sigma factor RsiW
MRFVGFCPSSEALAEFLEGGLPSACRRRVEAHLARCADCCASVAQASLLRAGDRAHGR